MTIESLLLTIEGSFSLSLVFGLLVGIAVPMRKLGCVVLLAVPVAMLFFVNWWQSQHPENLRSTSALDFMFGPLWPSLGALAGFYAPVAANAYVTA
jgi:hypothetical protein